jgi:MFS family permease
LKLVRQNIPFNIFLFAMGFFVAFFWQSVWFTQPLIGFYEHSLLDSALIIAAFSLPNILFSKMFGNLVDRIGEKKVFIGSLIVVIASGLFFYLSTALIYKIIFIFLSATGVLGVWLVLDVLAVKTQLPENRGEFFGILETVRDISYAITPTLIGLTFAFIGLGGIFIVSSCLAAILLVSGIIVFQKSNFTNVL